VTIGQEMQFGRALLKAKKNKRKRKYDKSHLLWAQTTTLRHPQQSRLGWVPDIVNNTKFHQNGFRGIGSLIGRNLPSSYA